MVVTRHACERFIERVDGTVSIEAAEVIIRRAERAVTAAAAFGCTVVRLNRHAKLRLVGDQVVTVIGGGICAGHLGEGAAQ